MSLDAAAPDAETALPLLTEPETSVWVPNEGERGLGALASTKGNLPLRRVDVSARIEGLFAEVEMEQTFVNDHDEAIEATYIFPLPERSAVQKLTLCIGAREVEGVVKERGEARREYREAIAAGRRAAVAEEERPEVFSLRAGNIPPGETVSVRLLLVGVLPCTDHEATFRFPLVVAERYVPGTPIEGKRVGPGEADDTDRAPDASRISPPVLLPGCKSPVRLSIRVVVDPAGMPVGKFRSSLHAVCDARDDDGKVCILLTQREKLDRDFILRWKLLGDEPAAKLLFAPDTADAAAGTFALTLAPPSPEKMLQRPRDVVFVLDRSGSMDGWKIVTARAALAKLVETLTPRDRFTVIEFDDKFGAPSAFGSPRLVPAEPGQRAYAVEYLHKIESRGGTEMEAPLELAAHLLSGTSRDRDRVLLFVTDGQIADETHLVRKLGGPLKKIRVFTLGIGDAANMGFVARLAQLGEGGIAELVESPDRLETAVERMHQAIGTPIATELSLHPSDFGVLQLVPGRLPPLFAGATTTIFGRYAGKPQAALEVQGTGADGKSWGLRAEAKRTDNRAVAAAWARGRLRELEDRCTMGAFGGKSKEECIAEIVRISVEQQTLCRYTAYLAVDRTEIVNAGGKLKEVVQAVEPTAASRTCASAPMQPAPYAAEDEGEASALAMCAAPPTPAGAYHPPGGSTTLTGGAYGGTPPSSMPATSMRPASSPPSPPPKKSWFSGSGGRGDRMDARLSELAPDRGRMLERKLEVPLQKGSPLGWKVFFILLTPVVLLLLLLWWEWFGRR